jgi:manganese/zinc/iron transport system substrate-binding protein
MLIFIIDSKKGWATFAALMKRLSHARRRGFLSFSFLLLTAFALLFAGCGQRDTQPRDPSRPIQVATTVTMVTDLVKQVGGERVQADRLMGVGVDPHLYKAAASDVAKLQNAGVIFYLGLMLQGKMQDMFTKLVRAHGK